MTIKIVPLGAGQDVGRSCILVTIGGKNIMFDCGMHMGFNDARRFPDFTYISKTGNFTEMIDAVIISHFHLDHCGALPFFTEMCGYDGPIYMTHPTKAICPILLEDYRKITVTKVGQENFFTEQMIKDCMKKVIPMNLHQTIKLGGGEEEEVEIKAYYAGHVLGAAMIHLKVGNESVVYTGDYNTTADRHLGAAWIDKCRPDVLITESTYATTIRDSKRTRERDFLKNVHECVANGGRVLIPCFALGRAQELCVLLESYWEQTGLKYPIYFSTGLTAKATNYYKMFIGWTNQKIKNSFVQRNVFDYKHIQPFDPNYLDIPGPMVLFSTPGMLHQGKSLEMFMKWAPNPQNMVIIPGYCVPGTVGAKILAGEKLIKTENFPPTEVNLKVRNLSFSAHADAKGIMQLIRQCAPRHVVLVHGEKLKMESLQVKIQDEYGIPTYLPANGNTVYIDTSKSIPVQVSRDLVERYARLARDEKIAQVPLSEIVDPKERALAVSRIKPITRIPIEGILMMVDGENEQASKSPSLISVEEMMADTRLPHHELLFQTRIPFSSSTILRLGPDIKPPLPLARMQDPFAVALGIARNALQSGLTNSGVSVGMELSARTLSQKITVGDVIEIEPIGPGSHGADSNEKERQDGWEEESWEKEFWTEDSSSESPHALGMKWSYADQDLAEKVLELLSSAFNDSTANEVRVPY